VVVRGLSSDAGVPGEAGVGGEADVGGEVSESVFGRMPVLLGEHEYGTAGAHATCFAYAVATWCFLTGSYVADLVGAIPGLVCLVAGNLIGVFITTMPLSLGCQRYGLEQMDFCKPAFGQRGAQILLVFYLINMLGWSGLILVMFGNGIRNIVETLGYQPPSWTVGAGVALGLWLSYLIVTRGVHLLNVANSIITPGLGILVAYMFYMLLTEHGWEAIASAPALDPGPKPMVNYLIAVELGIASGISWWGGIGFLARNTRTRRNAVYPEILQLGFATGVVCAVALFSALVVQSDDPTDWMVPIGGVYMGVLALAFVAFANVSSTAVSIFASGLALRHIPALRRRPWWQLMLLTILPCVPFVFWPQQLFDLGDAFLAYNGTMYAPIVGIVFVDFFFLRGQRISIWSIFDDAPGGEYHYTRGFHWTALGCVLLGQVAYLMLYNPLTGATADPFVPPSLVACLLPASVYWVVAKLRSRGEEVGERPEARRLISPNI
jgi:NCS1 family nucleobase:cation symporter-1